MPQFETLYSNTALYSFWTSSFVINFSQVIQW